MSLLPGTPLEIMIKSRRSMIIACVLLSIIACSENRPSESNKEIEKPSGVRTLRIVFDLPGDDIGAPEYRDILDKIKDAILRNQAGVIVRSGFGMGTMDIVVRTAIEQPTEKLSRIVLSQFPRAKFRIEEARESRHLPNT
jgi:hypothetical protein